MIQETLGLVLNHFPDEITAVDLVNMVLVELNEKPALALLKQLSLSKNDHPDYLLRIADALIEICDLEEQDALWIMCFLVKMLKIPLEGRYLSHAQGGNDQRYSGRLTHGKENEALTCEKNVMDMVQLMKSHAPELYQHLTGLEVDFHQACSPWFASLFAGWLDVHTLEGVWDIVIGGAPGLLPYIGLCLFISAKRKILDMQRGAQVVSFCQLIHQTVDTHAAAQSAIDLWERPLLLSMNS